MRMVKIMAALWGIFFILMLVIAGCSTKEVQVAEPEAESEEGSSGVSGMSVSAQASAQQQPQVIVTEQVITEESEPEEGEMLAVCGDGNCDATELESCEEDCPSCDDGNSCTSDSFDISTLKCKNTPIIGCCGDGFCAPDEDCSADCPAKRLTLASYPYPFVHGNELTADVVVGDEGSSKEVSAATAIALGLGIEETVYGILASEIATIRNTNIILIGNPCSNPFVAQLMPYKDDCLEDYKKGEGRLALFVTGKSDAGKDTYALVVSGYSAEDTVRAAELLENYEANMPKLKGTEVNI